MAEKQGMSNPSGFLLVEGPARQVLIGPEQTRWGSRENMRLLWAGPDSTGGGGSRPNQSGPEDCVGGLTRGCPYTPLLGILRDHPGARPGAGRLTPGGPSRGCWNEGCCYGNGRQGLGWGPDPGWGRGCRRWLWRGDGGARPGLLRPLRHVLAASVLQW